MGSPHAGAARPGDRLAGPPHRLRLRPASRGRARGPRARGHRPGPRSLLHGDEAGVGDRARRRRRESCRRNGRQLARSAPVRRARPRNRRFECIAHLALRHRARCVERGDGRSLRRADHQPASRGRLDRAHLDDRPWGVRRHCGTDLRHRRRPAGCSLRPGLHRQSAWPRTLTAPVRSCSCRPARIELRPGPEC